MNRKSTVVAGVLALATFITSCDAGSFLEPGLGDDSQDPAAIQVESLVLGHFPAIIAEDDTIRLSVTALDLSGDTINEALEVDWTSSDANVASFETVTATGADLLTGQPGITTITAAYQEISTSTTIEVHPRPVDLVYVSGANQIASPGATLPDSLIVRAVDKRGDAVDGVYITFSVLAGGGTVSPDGEGTDATGSVRAAWTLGSSGAQEVRARASENQPRVKKMHNSEIFFTAQLADTTALTDSVAAVTVDPAMDTVAIDSTTQLEASVYDGSGRLLSGHKVTWSSSDSTIATIDGSGLVTGVGEGHIVVFAAAQGKSDSASIAVTSSPGGSLAISPSADTLYGVGDTTTLVAEVRSTDGTPISDPDVKWSSQDTSIATVDSMGTVTARALGIAVIAASAACCDSGDFVEVAVVDDTVTTDTVAPARVSDLSVVAVGEDSVTLQWTQVDDGTGNPANYALRYGSPSLSWGEAYGTERTADGTHIGDTLSYTFTELTTATDYEFQLVSYRGTLNVDVAFGDLSNTATGTTLQAEPGQPASVTVTPDRATIRGPDRTVRLYAETHDSAGNVIQDASYSWRSADTSIAVVNTEGLVTSRQIGNTVVYAALMCGSAACDGDLADYSEISVTETAGAITLSGSGFGTKAAASPELFQTFDSLDVGDTHSTAGFDGDQAEYGSALVTTDRAHGGAHSLHYRYTSNAYPTISKSISGRTLYIAEWVYWEYSGGTPDGPIFKIGRANSGALYSGTPGHGVTIRPHGADSGGGVGVYTDGVSATPETGLSEIPHADGWHFVERKHLLSTPGVADGFFEMLVDGVVVLQFNPAATRASGITETFDWVCTFLNGMDKRGDGITYDLYLDEVLIDTTFARIVATDAQVYANSTTWAPQQPTAWTDTEITIDAPNWSNFTSGQTVYFHVFDAGDNHVAAIERTAP